MAIWRWGAQQDAATQTFAVGKFWDVAGLEGGGYVAIWTDRVAVPAQVMAQIFGATGHPVGGPIPISLPGFAASDAVVTGLAGGGFVVVWTHDAGASQFDQRARVYNAAGTLVHDYVLDASPSAAETGPAVARLGANYVHVEVDSGEIWVTVRAPDGTTVVDFVQASLGLSGTQGSTNVAAFEDGNSFAVVWNDYGAGAVRLGLFGAVGNALTSPISVVTTTPDAPPTVAAIGSDRVVVVWHEIGVDQSSYGVLFRIYSEAGLLLRGTTIATLEQDGLQARAEVTATADGGFVVSWEGAESFGRRVFARAFDSAGNPRGGEYYVDLGTATGGTYDVRLSTLEDGRIVAMFFEGGGLRTQILDPRDGQVEGSQVADVMLGNEMLGDQISGYGGEDRLQGLGGNDGLYGGADRDSLYGGNGDDQMFGDGGDDVLFGGRGSDGHYGGAGKDTAVYSDANAAVTVSLANVSLNTGFADGDEFFGVENLTGSRFADVLYGDGQDNVLTGREGDDRLYGGDGRDRLVGDDGNDVLQGGAGNDRLNGGLGADRFRFVATTEGVDVIEDFAAGDRLEFLGTAFGGLPKGALAPAFFVARADTQAQDANDHFIFRTTDSSLWFDADGSGAGAPVRLAILSNLYALSAGDILIV